MFLCPLKFDDIFAVIEELDMSAEETLGENYEELYEKFLKTNSPDTDTVTDQLRPYTAKKPDSLSPAFCCVIFYMPATASSITASNSAVPGAGIALPQERGSRYQVSSRVTL